MSESTRNLLDRAARIVAERGGGSVVLTREERIDWAYGNAVIENPHITREMVERAVDDKPPK